MENWKDLILELKVLAKDRGITHQKIADITGIERPNVTRMLSGKNSITVKNFSLIAAAIGVHVDINEV